MEEALTQDEFNVLVQGDFYSVHEQFADGQSLSERRSKLIDRVIKHREISKLLKLIEKINPDVYEEFKVQVEPQKPFSPASEENTSGTELIKGPGKLSPQSGEEFRKREDPKRPDKIIILKSSTLNEYREDKSEENTELNLKELQNCLKNKDWKNANRKTTLLILKATGNSEQYTLKEEDIKGVECQLLEKVDRLWIDKSEEYFGFSIQAHIWKSICEKTLLEKQKHFGRKVFWYTEKSRNRYKWITPSELNFEWAAYKKIKGYLPTLSSIEDVTVNYAIINALVTKLEKCSIQNKKGAN
ncbi:MAG: GUN4 domain-containing protein [Cyanobacteriota bacterium]|nr:GUN4 domain-containing protein [Cyanobacteriota bacterium]